MTECLYRFDAAGKDYRHGGGWDGGAAPSTRHAARTPSIHGAGRVNNLRGVWTIAAHPYADGEAKAPGTIANYTPFHLTTDSSGRAVGADSMSCGCHVTFRGAVTRGKISHVLHLKIWNDWDDS